MTSTQMNQNATNHFNAVFTRTDVTNIVINADLHHIGWTAARGHGNRQVPTKFLGIMNKTSLTINVSSTVKWGNTRLRVALVLDNTGSMADSGKIAALKTATNNLLTQLKNAAVNNGDVYVSIIPFVKDVNVDPVNYKALWIDWTAWDAVNGSCSRPDTQTRVAAHQTAKPGRRQTTTPGTAALSIAAPPTRPAP